jgi:HAD superfamily hydrolase (TIGR01509 family)
MIDDMAYHEIAWYDVLVNQLKAPLTKEQVRLQLYGKHDEMFYRIFGETRFTRAEIDAISFQKEQRYRDEFLPNLKLIDGLDAFLSLAESKGIALSIGTAAPPENVDFVLDNLKIRHYFPVIVGQADVKTSKPHPEVFLKAAALMNLQPEDCLVFEDAPKGIEAAKRAGIDAVAVTSFHSAKELENDNVIATISNYTDTAVQAVI